MMDGSEATRVVPGAILLEASPDGRRLVLASWEPNLSLVVATGLALPTPDPR
jgi:hypothetical protein